jgi:hypothetical protein
LRVCDLNGLTIRYAQNHRHPHSLGDAVLVRHEPWLARLREERFMATDEDAEDPARQVDRIFDLDFKIAIAGRPATGPRRPFGSGEGENEATGDEAWTVPSSANPVTGRTPRFRVRVPWGQLKAYGLLRQTKGENDRCLPLSGAVSRIQSAAFGFPEISVNGETHARDPSSGQISRL